MSQFTGWRELTFCHTTLPKSNNKQNKKKPTKLSDAEFNEILKIYLKERQINRRINHIIYKKLPRVQQRQSHKK